MDGAAPTDRRVDAATAPERARSRDAEHRFYAIVSLVAVVLIVTGFVHTYGPRLLAGGEAVPGIVHLHAAVFAGWLVLFVAQIALAARGRLRLHRRLGSAGMGVALVMLVLGAATAVTVTRHGHRGIPGAEFANPGGFLLLNLTSIFVFTALTGAAWLLRRRPQAHKRLMLMALLAGLAPPGIARLPLAAGHPPAVAGLVFALLAAGPIHDLLTRRRVHPAYVAGVLMSFLVIPPVVAALAATPAWERVAAWLLG